MHRLTNMLWGNHVGDFVEALECRTFLSAQQSGVIDPAFGQGGLVSLSAQRALDMQTVAATPLPHGKTLLLGKTYFPTDTQVFSSALERLNADGSPDRTFGTGGIRLLSDQSVSGGVGQPSIDPAAMAVDRKGRIYFGGHSGLARLLPNGSADPTFRGEFNVDGIAANINSIAIQHDGDIVVGGYYLDPSNTGVFDTKHNFSIARIHPDGTIDTSFGDQGRTIITFNTASGRVDSGVHALSIDDRGRILAAGGGDGQFDLVRLSRNGMPDVSFGDHGEASVAGNGLSGHFGISGADNQFFASVLQRSSSGEIFALGGSPINGSNADVDSPLVVAAFRSNGRPDLNFGDHGVVRLAVGQAPSVYRTTQPRLAFANGIAFLSHNRLLISGILSSPSGPSGLLLARLNADGSADRSFAPELALSPGTTASEGLHFVPIATGSAFIENNGLIAATHGRFLLPVANSPVYWPYAQFACLRLNRDGSLDRTYGNAGVGTTAILYPDMQLPTNLVTGPDSRIYLTLEGTSQSRTVTLKPDGNTDGSFVLDGGIDRAIFAAVGHPESGVDNAVVAIQPDGKRLVEDRRLNDGVALVRYNTDGTIDTTFGNAGYVQFGGGSGSYSIDKILIRADGSLVLSVFYADGFVYGPVTETIDALDPAGHLTASIDLPSVSFFVSYTTYADMAVTADGSVLLATHTFNPVNGESIASVLARLDGVNLATDRSYGVNGDVNLPAAPQALAVLPDGRAVVAGLNRDSGNAGIAALTAVTADGRIDTSFLPRSPSLPAGITGSSAGDLLPLRDGTMLLVLRDDSGKPTQAARYFNDGSIDTAFGDAGFVTLPAGSTIVSLQQTNDTQSLLVAGSVKPAQTSPYDVAKAESTAFVQRIGL